MEITGATYSTSHYLEFKRTGDQNIFEEIVDRMVLDGIEGINDSFKRAISKLPRREKRLAILSVLDKDRNLFKSIKSLIKGDKVSKMDHLKDIIYKIREYVKVGEVEQKKFGEVMSDLDKVVKPMINELPDEFWKDPSSKILDNCNGTGPFPLLAIWKLMSGLKDIIKDEESRYKHIVENMIYVAELQPKNMFIWMCIVDPYDEYDLNIYTGSFLESGFDRHMKEVWNVDRFQLILGNPPYQLMDGGAKASAKPLYNLFIEKSIKICDQLLYITPSRWFAGGKGLGPFRKMMMESNKIRLINHFDDATLLFGKSVEIKGGVSYFLYDQHHDGECLYNGLVYNLNNFDIIITDLNFSKILNRLLSLNFIFLDTICKGRGDNVFGIQTNDSRLIETKLSDDYIKCHVSIQKGRFKYINKYDIKNLEQSNVNKVITVEAATKGGQGFGNIYVTQPGEVCNGSYIFFVTNSLEESNSLKSYLETRFANKMLSMRKISQHIKPDTCKWIPILPLDRIWTDEDIFNFLNISEEEKSLF